MCAYCLYALLKFNPRDAKWDDRDRFVLSAGHGSMLHYSLLYLYGFGITKESVIPKAIKARVCVEAGSSFGWYKYAGDNGEIIAMESFGASAPADRLFSHLGFTVENVVVKAKH